jgi:hypothetical protein
MSKKKNDFDFIHDHHEYVNKLYVPGRLSKRITTFDINRWRWIRNNNRLIGSIGVSVWGIVLYGFIEYHSSLAQENNVSFWTALINEGVIGSFIFLIIIVLIFGYLLFLRKPNSN